jgi:hypothetical protein
VSAFHWKIVFDQKFFAETLLNFQAPDAQADVPKTAAAQTTAEKQIAMIEMIEMND